MKLLKNYFAFFPPPMASCLLATLVCITSPTYAEPDLPGDIGSSVSSPANNLIDSSSISTESPELPEPTVTPAQAADLVRRRTGGQVMGVNNLQTETGVVYGVKVLKSGRMRVVRVDGQTGDIIGN